ncbi:MAG: hypothetical protein IKU19_07005, partial [Clostridia bacterium]|nr:hypothetical protein [Clostridia bacterium]
MKRSFALLLSVMLIALFLTGCSQMPKEPSNNVETGDETSDLPAYTAEYTDGYLSVNVNDIDTAELVVPCPENGIFPDSCTDHRACIYNDGFCNLPKIITAEDYENHILTLVDASGLTTGITSKFRVDFFFAKIDPFDPQLSTEKKE